jgi:DNA-binding HxlR family transcriptional regulator
MKAMTMRSDCPISCTLDLLGDKWSLLIMRDLLFFDTRSFGAFLLSDEGIAKNILADRLRELQEKGFIVKEVSAVNKSKFLYYPTEKGVDLVPLLLQLAAWSEKHEPECRPKRSVAAFIDSKGAAMQALRKSIRKQTQTTK